MFDNGERHCCTLQNVTNSSSLVGCRLPYAYDFWHAQLRHMIEHRAFYQRFGALRLKTAGPQPAAEESLESEHRMLGDALARAPTDDPPGIAPLGRDLPEDVITRSGPADGIRGDARLRRAPEHEGRRCATLEDRLVAPPGVVSPIPRHLPDR